MHRTFLRIHTLAVLMAILILASACKALAPAETAPVQQNLPVQTDLPAALLAPTTTSAVAAPLPILENCRLALLLPAETNASFNALKSSVEQSAARVGCQWTVYTVADDLLAFVAQVKTSPEIIQGVILVQGMSGVDGSLESAALEARAAGIPLIVIGPSILPAVKDNRVVPDLTDGVGQAAEFLCQAIHQRGIVIQLADGDSPLPAAFTSQMQAGCPQVSVSTITVPDSSETAARQAIFEALSQDRDISAVFAYSAASIQGASAALVESGILGVVTAGFGEQIKVVGLDEIGGVNAVVRSSPSGLGKAAVLALVNQIQGAAAPAQILAEMEVHTADVSFRLPPDPTARPLTIGVILPGVSDEFSHQIYRGLMSPATSLDNITLKIRSAGHDPQVMLAELNWMTQAHVNALLIAPIKDPQVYSALDAVIGDGLPVITLGYPLANPAVISQIRFDEYSAGYRAGEAICSASSGQGNVLDIFDTRSLPVEEMRSLGLAEYLQENCPALHIMQLSASPDQATMCSQLEQSIRQSQPLAGIFAHSDQLALCAVPTLESRANAGVVVGIGASAEGVKAVREGRLFATLGQYPYEMGVIAMETTILYLYGQPIEYDKPFPANLITREGLQ